MFGIMLGEKGLDYLVPKMLNIGQGTCLCKYTVLKLNRELSDLSYCHGPNKHILIGVSDAEPNKAGAVPL